MWYIFTMENYSSIKKKDTLTFVTTRMGVEGIMLSEIDRKKTNVVCSPLHVESKKMRTRWNREYNYDFKGQGVEGNAEVLVNGSKLPGIRGISSGDLMYNIYNYN